MEAAFVDIGTPKNAVLYRGDVQYDAEDVERERRTPRIEQILKAKQTIICQVTKNPIGAQGRPPHPGGLAAGPLRGADPELRDLRHLQAAARRRAQAPARDPRQGEAAEHGVIVRTAAEGVTSEEISRRRAPPARAVGADRGAGREGPGPGAAVPRARHGRPGDPRGVQRRLPRRGHRRRAAVRRGPATTSRASRPALADRVAALRPRRRAAARSSSATTCTSSSTRRSTARCGCPRAARSSSSTPRRSPSSTSTPARTSASRASRRRSSATTSRPPIEIAQQLRLRDIGGIIVIDFIDMEIRANRDEVIKVVPRRPRPRQDPHPGVRHLRARAWSR